MSVRLNEAAISRFFNSTTGPLGIYMAKKASLVEEQALINASGPILGIRSGQLVGQMTIQLFGGPDGVTARVGSSATSTWKGAPFSYPAFWEDPRRFGSKEIARPWLTTALRTVFPL